MNQYVHHGAVIMKSELVLTLYIFFSFSLSPVRADRILQT